MKRRSLILIGLGAVLALFLSTALAAAPQVGGGLLARGKVGRLNARTGRLTVRRTIGSTDVAVARFTFEPGSSSGWHRHPGVLFVTVKSGTLQKFNHHCQKKVYKKGATIVEEGRHVLLVRNRAKANAVVYVTFIVPSKIPSDRLTIPVQAPQGCNIE
jgi:quercetin dioxygenase-like cupin family protein